ncbi:MAG: UDP-N-acetylmuramoyl-L-alanyl-D-glutamate--2,6-diaminopimelate ligase [Deltaproteobacteria bacterium]|nr:UDP-N-acetylmuramoyl-L-alanyl-D-glutamate--2,6-diaminopimelate ligase [Deltaproteobacteria bacterium]
MKSSELKMIGVTGTSGKTTVTYLLESIFMAAGFSTGVIGTIEYRVGTKRKPATLTTPDSKALPPLLGWVADEGATHCVMEVSSHALVQGRVAAVQFDGAIFTNLTPEHLDYHADMESYFQAKSTLFTKLLNASTKPNRFAVVNTDDPFGKRLCTKISVPLISYGEQHANVFAEKVDACRDGLVMSVKTPRGKLELHSPLIARLNVPNILAAVATAQAMDLSTDAIVRGIANMKGVKGRFELVSNAKGVIAIVDYAHKPDALRKVLEEARALAMNRPLRDSPEEVATATAAGGRADRPVHGRVLVIFGCGGDRDRQKRPVMGETAAELADVVVVTSDNPRSESAEAIIAEILPGVKKKTSSVQVIPDRREAIRWAVNESRPGDVLVVAGKGHEDYQIIGNQRNHFDDREELEHAFVQRR